jgi:uncharacterized protein with NAD-binding domain and iron-sulfur cluster
LAGTAKRKVVIVGGGMAGLTAAWELSRPGWRDRFASITVYQRGARLGGKGASSRGVHGRIEEHGLHVWLGYYENAFRLMREVYDELDRPTTDPTCAIRTFDDAFVRASTVGVGDRHNGQTAAWIVQFGEDDDKPGLATDSGRAVTIADVLRRWVQLVGDALESFEPPVSSSEPPPGIYLTGSAAPPGSNRRGRDPFGSLSELGAMARQAELASVVATIEGLTLLTRLASDRDDGATRAVAEQITRFRDELVGWVRSSHQGRRMWHAIDLVFGCALAAVEDDLLGEEGFARIDHLDFREWLTGRVAQETLESSLVRGLYDLVFAYEGGNHGQPRFSAGLGLFLASRLFFEYRGAIFWKMTAGMGDVVFAPLYQALRRRGVDVFFFHRLDRLGLAPDGRSVARVGFGCQVRPDQARRYDPLVRVGDLPCFPSTPSASELATLPPDAETAWADRSGETDVELEAGVDFDVLVLAVSLGMVPLVAPELIKRVPGWRELVDHVATVATESLQLWLRPTEAELGWARPGATVSGSQSIFDTYSSMSHLSGMECWPDAVEPRTIGYFCGALPDAVAHEPRIAEAAVRRHVDEFSTHGLSDIWPRAVDEQGHIRQEVLAGDESVYFRANVDPSDRYVQSLPGTGVFRLRPDQSGVENLVLAGDWTNCGLNAGCVEAAVMSGIEAANVVARRPLTDGLAGRWYGLERAVEVVTMSDVT